MLPTTPQRPSMTFERRGSCDLFECVEAHKRFSEGRSRMIFAQISKHQPASEAKDSKG